MDLTEKQKEIARNAINANRAAQGNKETSAQPKSNFGSGLSSAQRALAESAVAQIVNRHEDNDLASIAANLGRDKKRTSTRTPGVTTAPDNIGAAALDDAMGVARPTAKTAKTPSTYNPYKSYNQPDGLAANGEAKQTTKAYSDKRLQDEALRLYKEYGGKSYTEIQDAISKNTGSDYMALYQNQVLAQIGQQNRTRADIEREIAETEAELEVAQVEWDRISNDVTTTYGGGNAEEYNAATERVNALTGRKERLKSELWMWDQGEIYSAVPGYSDYKKNSAINPENGEWDDPVYRYINNIQRDGTVASENRMAAYEYMTPEEVGIYNYLYNVSGREAAEKYLEYLEFSLSDKRQREVFENAYGFAGKNFGTKAAASLASFPAKLLSGAGYLDVLGQRLNRVVTGSDKPINYNRGAQTAYNFAQGAREGTMSGMSDTGKFIYSTAMSMGDSLGVLGVSLLTGGSGATMLLGGSAATSTMHEAKANGASDGQALAMGFIAGAAETIMEELPLEKLLNITPASNWVEFIQNSIKQGANEATEEVLTTLVNTAADVLIMGDKNALMRSYEKYLAQGYTPEEAERLAKNEWWLGLAGDAFAGFLSGGMFGLGGTAIKSINQYADRTERGKGISASEHTLPLLIDHVEKGYTNKDTKEPLQYSEETKKTAEKIKSDLAAGKTVSNAQKGKLAEQILKDNAEFNEKVLPGILLEAQKREDAAVGQKDEMSSKKNEMSSKEVVPKRNVVQTIRDRLQKRADAKAGANNVDSAAAKILAQEVLNDESTYSKKTRAAAERIINGETVNEADSQALVSGIKTDNTDFSGYTAEEIIAEASVLAQEEAQQSTGTETTAEIKTAVPQSTAQQTTTEGAITNEQRTDGTGNEQRSTEGDTARADRGRGRFSETYSGDAAPVSTQNRDVGAAKSRAQTAGERQNKVADLRIEPTSAASLGIKGGSEDATMYIIPEEAYDEELKSIAADAKENGVTVHFFTGVMPVNNSYANASVSGNEMYVRADSAKYTAAEIYDHEKFHKIFRGKPGLITELYNWIRNNYTAERFDDIIDTYYDKYNDVYGLDEMSADEALRIVLEEIFADAYAGTNKFAAGATEYTAPTRAAADAMGATTSEYNANQGRAPPQGMTYDDVKQAVREVMSEVMGTEGNENTAEDGVENIDTKNSSGVRYMINDTEGGLSDEYSARPSGTGGNKRQDSVGKRTRKDYNKTGGKNSRGKTVEDGISSRGKSRRIEEIIVFALDQNPDGRVLLSKNTIKDIVDRIVNIVNQTREADGLLTEAYPGLKLTDITEIRNILNSDTKLVASSKLTENDKRYFEALKNDYEEAERMVQEAANSSGYKLMLNHFTDEKFTVFEYGELGFHVGTIAQAEYIGNGRAGRVLKLYAKAEAPLYWPVDIGYWSARNFAATMEPDDAFDVFENADEIRSNISEIAKDADSKKADAKLIDFLKSLGFDSIRYENTQDRNADEPIEDSYILFDSWQLKSAETVTYDDDGKIIPLSQRFDASNPDIRFAISDEYDVAPEDRTWADTGDRKFNSYAYDHPELRPYFKEAARSMFYDLLNSVKGERWSTTSDSKNWTGSKRNTTENIARLLDNGKMTYKRIQEALLTMLYKAEDGKAMNRADVKKVELELDAMLQEGYTDPTGLYVEPNREYRRLLDAIKSGYGSVEEADAAYEAEVRDEAYEAQVEADAWEGYDQRADEMYDDVYSAYEPGMEAYEDISQEDRDYLGEIVESADELRLQRMADEKLRAAEELDEENEALRLRNMEYAEEANNYFDAYNYEELENERRRMDAVMQNAFQNPDISAAPDTSAEHWESISAQLIEEKRRQKRENAVAEAENNDMYLPDGVSDAEILAAQEKYREQMAARKAADEAKYEGLTAEEAEAAKEADARRAQAEYLEGVDRKNFVGSDAMEKLKIKISRSIANYKSSAGLIERAKANAALVREMDKAIQKMHPSEEEKYFATGIMNNDLSEYSIPMHLDAERVLELADYMVARKAGRTDLFAAQKADINNRNRQLASDKFKNAEKAKRVSLTRLNYMTPRRAMIEMFGQEQGEEIYRTFFAPVRTNDAERIRFAERLRQEALEIVGADGKKGKLTKEERALTQMLMEGKAAGEMLAKMETGGKERIEAAAKRILKGEPLREENGKYVVGEEGADELSAKEAEIARRHAAYTQAQEAIRTGTFDKKKVDGTRITNAAKHFAQQYDMLYDAINEFLVAHGEQPIGFIKGYAPHLQAEDAMKPLERLLGWMGAPTDITDLRAEIAGETHNRKPNRKWNPHFLSRTVGSETEYDVYKGFEEYVDYISEVFYHMDDIMRLRAASRYLRTAYTTEDSKNQLKQIEEVRNGGYYEKMNFLLANNRIARGETLIGAEIDEALDKYIDEILNEEENKTAVSSSLVMWLDNYTNLLAGKQNAMDRGLEQQIGRKGIRAVNKAVNRLISAQVVGNISSALNQMAQMPMTITELGADNVSKALWDLVRHSGEMRRWSTENDFLTARKGTTILNYQITDKLTNGLAKPLELADYFMSSITARAAYHQALKQGMDVESAMDYSVQKAEDIMGSRNKASKPVAFSTKNPIMRLVNAYQIEVLNQWQHIIKDLPREYKSIAQSRGKWAAAGRIAKDLVLYLILAALINRIAEETYGGTPAPLDLLGIVGNFAASGNGLTLNEGIVRVINSMTGKMFGKEWLKENHTFDSEMPDEFDWGAAWEDTAYTLSSEIPFLNNILAAAGLTDDKTVFAAGVTDAIESGKKAIDHFFVTRREREEGEQESAEVLDGLYDVAMGISEFILGGRQLQKTIQGVVTLSGGGEKNSGGNLMYPVADTVGNWIKGTLFGKTALENSRAYYASGASPLNSTRNEQYFGMVERGVDEDNAYAIAQGLADVTSDKDEDGNTISGSKFRNQMDYVMNADIPDEVKDFLALSIASDAAYERYESYGLEASGVDPAAFMLGWALYQSATGEDKAGQTEAFLRQQGVSAGDIAKIIAALKKKK